MPEKYKTSQDSQSLGTGGDWVVNVSQNRRWDSKLMVTPLNPWESTLTLLPVVETDIQLGDVNRDVFFLPLDETKILFVYWTQDNNLKSELFTKQQEKTLNVKILMIHMKQYGFNSEIRLTDNVK